MFYNPAVLSSNRLHIVSSFPITTARKDLHEVLKEGLADRKENSGILSGRKEINQNLTAVESCHLLLGKGGGFYCSSVEAAVSLEAEEALLTILPAK